MNPLSRARVALLALTAIAAAALSPAARADEGFVQLTIYKAGCSQTPASEPLGGHATLRYNPPGVLVKGHYLDLAMCRNQTGQLSAGVELIEACTAS